MRGGRAFHPIRRPRVYQPVKTAPGFPRLAWSNLAAQSAEQIGLAATPLVGVLALGAGAGETGFLQTAQRRPPSWWPPRGSSSRRS